MLMLMLTMVTPVAFRAEGDVGAGVLTAAPSQGLQYWLSRPDVILQVSLLALACLIMLCVFISRRRSAYRKCAEGMNTHKLSMFDDDCLLMFFGVLVLVLAPLAGFYYYFCYLGGYCFGWEMKNVAAGVTACRKIQKM